VQFIFGGDSRMQVGSTGRVELCPRPSATHQQIAIYGMTPAAGPEHQQILEQEGTAVSLSTPAYNPAKQAQSVGEGQAQVSIPASGTASITVNSFPMQPDGSIIEGARLKVLHTDDSALQLSLGVTDGTTPLFPPLPLPAGNNCNPFGQCQSQVDLTTQFRNDPTLTSRLNATFTATAPGAGGPYNSAVDAIVLDLTVAMPGGYRQLTGCTQLPIGTASDPQACPLVSTVPGAQLYVQGTVYAPKAGLDVNGQPDDPVRFNRGIIARTVVFRPGNGGAPAGVTAGGAFNRFVVLNATVKTNPRLVASVSFDDAQAFVEQRPPKITYNGWDVK
jgi:hypothetical protein